VDLTQTFKMVKVFVLALTLIYNNLYLVNCLNVDTEFPIIFESTFGNIETYFGLAVDMQKTGNQTT